MGPVSAQAFETLVRDRIVQDDTLVWAPGFPEWRPWAAMAPETAVCAASGGRYLQRDMVPYQGGFISAEHKNEFFQKLREGVSTPGALRYAGFWVRFLAKFIDGLVVGFVNLLVGALLGALLLPAGRVPPGQIGTVLAVQGLIFLIGTTIHLGYYWFFLARYAATPGKAALTLKVVRGDGSPLSHGRIIGRFFAEFLSGMILWIGYIIAAFDEQKQALHDRICDTRVIHAK